MQSEDTDTNNVIRGPLQGQSGGRLYEMDWLRVGVILFVFFFHAGLIFSITDLGVHADWTNDNLARLLFFTSFLRMPVLFFVAGAGTWFLFRRRTVREFLSERARRLLIPVVVALLTIIPLMNYIGYRFQAEKHGDPVQSLGEVFVQLLSAIPYEFMHLWFIAYLIIFSALLAPLLSYLASDDGRAMLDRMLSFLNWRAGIFLLAIPMIVIEWSMAWRWSGSVPLVNDWPDFTLYLYLFLCGFVLVGDERFWIAVQRLLPVTLPLFLVLGLVVPAGRTKVDFSQAFVTDLNYTIVQIGMGVLGWITLIAVLALGRRYLSFENGVLRYARDASYPFYLLHMLPLWAIAYVVVDIDIPAAFQALVITILSFAATVGMYEIMVRRTEITRLAFGLKPRAKKRPAEPIPSFVAVQRARK